MKIKLLFFMNIVMSINDSPRLYTLALKSHKNKIDNDTLRILERIYPYIFDDRFSPERTGFNNIFYSEILSKKHVNLSKMNIERIPIEIAERMNKIKSIDLSDNSGIRLEEEWFKYFYENLEELNLNFCNISNENLKILQKCKSMKKLSLSKHKNLDILHLLPILDKITHLDVSNTNLNEKDLNIIFRKCVNLEYLNFEGNKLSNLSCIDKSNIKVLNISNCELELSEQITILLNLNQLEDINLSFNNFSSLKSSEIDKIFNKFTDNSPSESNCPDKNSISFTKLKHLKKLNLSFCQIKMDKFIENVFDIKGLEVIDLSGNSLNFSFKELVNGKAKNTLREIYLESCKILSYENLYFLTNFTLLEKIDISDNNFHSIPDSFSLGISKNSLKEIKISLCSLNHNGLKAIMQCSKLEKLDVSKNEFSKFPILLSLGPSKETLKVLNVSDSQMNCYGLIAITECSKLEKLRIDNNSFENIPEDFSFNKLKGSLRDLSIFGCSLNNSALSAILECEKIEFLDVSFNDFKTFSNELDNKFNIKFKDHLKVLKIDSCNFNIKHLEIFTDCINLEILEGSKNNFNSLGDQHLKLGCSKNSLKKIDLLYCKLDEHGFKELTDCSKLEVLDLENNNLKNISNNFQFGESKNSLKSLSLGKTKLGSIGLKAITDCTNLKCLILSECNFADIQLSFSFKNLKNSLENLDMNNCFINYNCLKAVSKCRCLKNLNISVIRYPRTHIKKINHILKNLDSKISNFSFSLRIY